MKNNNKVASLTKVAIIQQTYQLRAVKLKDIVPGAIFFNGRQRIQVLSDLHLAEGEDHFQGDKYMSKERNPIFLARIDYLMEDGAIDWSLGEKTISLYSYNIIAHNDHPWLLFQNQETSIEYNKFVNKHRTFKPDRKLSDPGRYEYPKFLTKKRPIDFSKTVTKTMEKII